MDDLHQLLGSSSTGIALGQVRIDQMLSDMVLKDLGDEPFQGSTARGGLLKDPSALLVALDRAFDRLNLPLDAPQAVKQLRPVPFDMSHFSSSQS